MTDTAEAKPNRESLRVVQTTNLLTVWQERQTLSVIHTTPVEHNKPDLTCICFTFLFFTYSRAGTATLKVMNTTPNKT